MPPIFRRESLEWRGQDRDADPEDGYRLLLDELSSELRSSETGQIDPEEYIKREPYGAPRDDLINKPKTSWVARQFLRHIGTYDEQKKTISAFDVNYALYDIYGKQFKEPWVHQFLKKDSTYSVPERIRIIGAPLLDRHSSRSLKAKSLALLDSLALFLNASPRKELDEALAPSLEYYFSQVEPPVFVSYLQVTLKDFIGMGNDQKKELFAKRVIANFPDKTVVAALFQYLTFTEAAHFTQECFKVDARRSLPLFESVRLPSLRARRETKHGFSLESGYFPNLVQETPFDVRQRAIDDFLGEPVLVIKTNFWDSVRQNARPTIKKYIIVGNTEVFSIESGKPGPTTLVFAPHFHEDNPRKMFHWIKDLPLQSGRVILMPEANRAMHLAGKDTQPMNRVFNKALSDDRMDYLVVRHVESLMGLVDGMIGLHDWGHDAGFISDIIPNVPLGNQERPGPVPGRWIPAPVKEIQSVSHKKRTERAQAGEEHLKMEKPPHLQWQVAEQAARLLKELSGQEFEFTLSPVSGVKSTRANNSTAFMNYFLHKPAMTFEGHARSEHGQLHAMATYSLLRAYGHRIDDSFVAVLKNPRPTINPELYKGLPIGDPKARRSWKSLLERSRQRRRMRPPKLHRPGP